MSLLEDLFSQGTIERLGWMLVHFLWQATAVALVLAVLLRLLRRATANLRYAVACGALALMVVLPLITMQLVEIAGPVAEAGPLSEISPPTAIEPGPATVRTADSLPPLSPVPPLETADLTTPIPWRERVIAALEPALPYIVLGWLIGVFGLSTWHLGGWTQLHRLKRRMTRRTSVTLHTTLDELATRLGVRRAVTLLESALVEVPTVVGWLRPVILLPASALTGLGPDQLQAILAHELAHIRRYDYLANILQTVVEILGFYHPAVWWVSTRIRVERENCCDDLAVQVCGNSLQYARALTSLEEIRHSRSDLAVAANGGGLMARIARLLGRPAMDDRRFAWLPGLITLLLVVGVVIPTALALTRPAPQLPEPPANDASALVDPAQSAADPQQILLKFSLFPKVSPDTVVDRETRNLLAGVLTAEDLQALRETIHADPRQDVTLGEILRTWIANRPMTPETMGVLIDVLQSRGYLHGESTPEVLASDNQQARISFGGEELTLPPTDPASPPPTVKLGTSVQVTPHIPPLATDRVLLEIEAEWKERANPDDLSDTPALRATEMVTTIMVPNGTCTALVTKNTGAPDDHLYMLLVSPTIIVQPEPATGQAPNESTKTVVESPTPNSTQPQDKTQVLVEFALAKALADAPLDRETMLLVAGTLAAERPQIVNEIAAGPNQEMTLGEVLKKYVTARSLSPETGQALLDLLRTRGFVSIQSTPKVIILDGEAARVRIVTVQPVLPPTPEAGAVTQAAPETIEYGTSIDVTPHIEEDKYITLDTAIEVVDPAPRSQPSGLPVVRTQAIETTVTLPNNRCFWLLVDSGGDKTAQNNDLESMLVILRSNIVQPATLPANPPATQISQSRKRPRQVLLDTRVVEVGRGNLLSLGVEWSSPTISAGGLPSGNGWARGLSIGYSPDQTFTTALIAKLGQLEAANQAEIVANPQIVAQNGRPAQLRSSQAEWFLMSDASAAGSVPHSELQKIESGTILTLTPRVGDSNEITLEMAINVFEALPRGRPADRPEGLPSDLPIVTRRQTKNSVTVRDGGTVAVAGLTENRNSPSGRTTREVAIFVTATLLSETDQIAPSRQAQDGNSTISRTEQARLSGKITAQELLASPQNSRPAGQSGINETRYLRLNHQTPQRVRDLLPPT